ncbi:MAG: GNAT family N-acetyltransferase [Lachnospiraceae bacterium]|nr:GNAT family N-acetyltransferase [Lachnospiraceae bacterium]
MKTRQEAIDELTLALLYLTRFPDGEGNRYDEISWKNYDFDAIDRLDEAELIINPKSKRGRSDKYAYMTESGRNKARDILASLDVSTGELYEKYEFRDIREAEAEIAADIEEICFPPNEACSRDHMKEQIKAAPDLFLVAVEKDTGKIAGFINGIATNEMSFKDEFFTDASTHDPEGNNVMICGLDVLPEYRKQGLARELVFNYCRREEEKGRRRLVLTCHDNKVKMYKKLGFRDLGESASEWGGVRWHEMDIFLNF